MNSGVLQFTLGLSTEKFLSNIGVGSRAVLVFAAMGEAANFSLGKMMEAVNRGAALGALAARTNQSAQSLYGLEMGFKGVGLSADALPGLIMRIQKSLSGVNEMGGSTNHIFSQLGLNMEKLRYSSAATQITTIAAALSKLGTTAAAGAASQLFGRFGAGDMLQIARAMDEYKRVMAATQGDAAVFGAMAKSWMEIKGDVEIFDSHVNAIWAAIATGITPELHKMMEEVNNFTGKLGPAIAGAFQFGQFHILLSDALMAGIEEGSYYGVRIFSAMAVGLGDGVSAALQLAFTDFLPMYVSGIKNASKLAASYMAQETEMKNVEAYSGMAATARKNGDEGQGKWYDSLVAQNRDLAAKEAQYQAGILKSGSDYFHAKLADGAQKITDAMVKGLGDVIADWNKTQDPNAPHTAWDKLNMDMQKLGDAWLSLHPEPADAGGGNGVDLGNHYKRSGTAFEKMGFIADGNLSTPMRRTEDLLGKILDKLPPKGYRPTLGDVPGFGWLTNCI